MQEKLSYLLDELEAELKNKSTREDAMMLALVRDAKQIYVSKQKRLTREGARPDVKNGPEPVAAKEEDGSAVSPPKGKTPKPKTGDAAKKKPELPVDDDSGAGNVSHPPKTEEDLT